MVSTNTSRDLFFEPIFKLVPEFELITNVVSWCKISHDEVAMSVRTMSRHLDFPMNGLYLLSSPTRQVFFLLWMFRSFLELHPDSKQSGLRS